MLHGGTFWLWWDIEWHRVARVHGPRVQRKFVKNCDFINTETMLRMAFLLVFRLQSATYSKNFPEGTPKACLFWEVR